MKISLVRNKVQAQQYLLKLRDGGIKTRFSNMIAVHPKGMGFEFEKIGKMNAMKKSKS